MIIQLPEGPADIVEFTVCRDAVVLERSQQKEQCYRQLAEDSPATLKRWGFDVSISRLQKSAAIGSVKIMWKTLLSSG
jgi:hypothetical protein